MIDCKRMILAVALALSNTAGCKENASNVTSPAPNASASRPDTSDIPVRITSTDPLETTKAILTATVRGDPQGETPAEFYGQHTITGRLKSGGNVMLNSQRDMARVAKRETFILLASSAGERTHSGRITFSYDPINRLIYATPHGAYTNLWSGVALAHETYHAFVDQGEKTKRDATADRDCLPSGRDRRARHPIPAARPAYGRPLLARGRAVHPRPAGTQRIPMGLLLSDRHGGFRRGSTHFSHRRSASRKRTVASVHI